MNRRKALVGVSLALLAGSAWAAEDPQIGNWKLDVAKSRYVTATPPRGADVTITPYGKAGVSVTVDSVTAKGDKVQFQYSAEYDGKPYPRIESGPGAIAGQMVTLRRVDARTVERIAFLAGKPVGTETWVIAADGKTRTVRQSGTDAAGKPIDNTLVYVKR